ncbi:MAG: hypothetical protein IPL61_27675 [Myxococcales bacterium]|nr:hypothetical protein [Myxococcales bacterium]
MRHLLACAALLLLVPVAGCGDNLSVTGPVDAAVADAPDIDAVAVDARPIDAMIDASCPVRSTGVGAPCTTDPQCDSTTGAGDGFCLRGAQGTVVWPTDGYCVLLTDCTTDASCGAGNICATINDPLGAYTTCLPACGLDPCSCPDGQVCATSFTGAELGTGQTACLPGNASASDGAACTEFAECAQDSLCQNGPFEFPNGQCGRIGCTVGDDSTCATGGDGHCVDLAQITSGFNNGTLCVDRCVADVDCRQADGYKCFDGGVGVGKYCRHPQVGDTCAAAADCGDTSVWTCSTALPGGACTLLAACPTPGSSMNCPFLGSICWDGAMAADPNICVDRCGGPINTQGGCRAGLVCRDVDPGAGTRLGCIAP